MPVPDSGLWTLSRTETQADPIPDDAQILALPATAGEAPLSRGYAHVRADILAHATTPPADPRVPEWVDGAAYQAGQLVSYHTRVWRCVTDLGASVTAPTFSNHWMAVGGWSGAWNVARHYTIGNWVTYQGQFYVATQDVAANLDPPPNSPNRWAHLAPDLAGFRGIWIAGGRYYRGDVVWQSEHFYVCVAESVTSNMGPVADIANWDPQGIYHDDWDSTRRYAAGDMVSYGDDDGIWISPLAIAAAQPAPGTTGATWRRVDNDEIEAWAHIGSTARIPRERLEPPTAGLSGERVSLRYGAAAVDLPLSQVGSDPDADRGGTMSAAQVRKLQDLVPITPRGAWVGNQREYGVGDLVHRQYENHAIVAYAVAAHSSTTVNGPTPTGNAIWATLLAVPRPDWDAAAGSPAAIRNQPDVPGAITGEMLLFDGAGIHSGHGGNYWHRTSVVASSIPAGSEVAFEFPYTWSPTPRLWSHWPGAPTEVATEWWLRDVTPQDGGATIDRIPAPDSSFVVGGDAHYHPFGYIDTSAAPRQMEIREIALIVDAAGYLCFCTRLDPPTVGDHPNAARATGIRLLWRSA